MFNDPSAPAVPMIFRAVALDDDDRDKALKRTAKTIRDLDDIRKALDLPPDMLRLIMEAHISSERTVAFEREQAELAARTQRLPMKIDSHGQGPEPLRILPGQVAQITSRPQWSSYRVEEIEIHGDPSRWIVHGIRVGNREQSMQGGGPYPGELFRKGGIMSELRLEVCYTAMDFVLSVEYVGPNKDGEVFEATTIGTAVDYPRCC